MNNPSVETTPRSRGRLWLWLGLVVAIAGPPAYAVQAGLGKLTTPWYVLALAVLGAALLVRSLFLRGTIWRVIGLLFCAGLVVFEGWFLLSATKLPAYSGPLVGTGAPGFPEFHAARADGTPFTAADLKSDQETVMVFFRGHW